MVLLISNLTAEERERLAYITGDVDAARMWAQLDDTQGEVVELLEKVVDLQDASRGRFV